MIRFENDPEKASAPAAVVRVTQQLDSDLDWTTFRLGTLGFGDTVVDAGGNPSFQTRLDLIDQFGIYLDVSAGVDLDTGDAFWEFKSIDPETGEVPFDPFLGFLPPNKNGSEGQGVLTYSIKPKADAATGDRIDAIANIVFDQNETILTPAIFNTIDDGTPSSQVATLPAQSVLGFVVEWSGQDDAGGSGVSSYTIYVSDNGGPFQPWLTNTTSTQATFDPALDGHTYAFYSIATDAVGHIEAPPESADAQTVAIEPETVEVANIAVTSWPTGTIQVQFDEPMDVHGMIDDGSIVPAVALVSFTRGAYELTRDNFAYDGATQTLGITLPAPLPAGYYELRLAGNSLFSVAGHVLRGGQSGLIFEAVTFGPKQDVMADGAAVKVEAYSVPALTDWNADGLVDLIVGEQIGNAGKLRVYLNQGTNAAPQYAAPVYAQTLEGDLTVPAVGCLGLFPRLFDWNGDGERDLVLGLADGRVQLWTNVSTAQDPLFAIPRYVQVGGAGAKVDLDVGERATVDVVDWDNDGRDDLIVGGLDGKVRVYLNTAASGPADFRQEMILHAGSGELVVPGGRASVAVADLNGDGREDLVVGNTDGQVLLYLNHGSDNAPAFAAAQPILTTDGPIDLPCTSRSRPFLGDFNADGVPDILLGAADGLVRWYAGQTQAHSAGDSPGRAGGVYSFTFELKPFAAPPSDIDLAGTSIAENFSAGTLVGLLATTDPDPGDAFTYSLVAGLGSEGNAMFTIPEGTNEVRSAAAFDFETLASYDIRVQTMDSAGNTFAESFTIAVLDVDEIPPTVTINQAAGQADPTNTGPIHFTAVFSEPVAGFAAGDVVFGGTAAGTLVAVVTPVNPTTYDVAVSGMAGSGTVTASVWAGAAQDAAGNLSGASTSADNSVTYSAAPSFSAKFDFGTTRSLGEPGYTRVSSKPRYTAVQKFGWLSGKVGASDTKVGTALDRDVNTTRDGTFAVDVPPGVYQVVLVLGDHGKKAHDQMGVFLEDAQVDSVTTAARATVTRSYTVLVEDGQLTVRLKDLGGRDKTVAIAALSVDCVGPDTEPPQVTISQATGQQDPTNRSTIHFTAAFSEPVFGFTADDVTLAGTAPGPLTMQVLPIDNRTFDVAVGGLTGGGTVVVTVAAGAAVDAAGNPNLAAQAVDNTAEYDPRWFFDFGTSKSLVEAGYQRVHPKTKYTDALGYGWQLGKISSADRKTGTALDRDLNLTADGTFAVQVPDGTYDVTLRLGDLGSRAHEQMGVFLEDNQVDTVDTLAKSVETRTYRVVVSGGLLTVRLKDLGGEDKNVAITGLTVAYVGAAAPLVPPEGEARLSGVGPMQNPVLGADVDGDSLVTALDALRLINYLNANPAGGALPASSSTLGSYLDVNGDGEVTPVDVLFVVNYVNGGSHKAGEGESSSPLMTRQPRISQDDARHAEPDGYFGEAESGFEFEAVLSDIAADVSRGWLD